MKPDDPKPDAPAAPAAVDPKEVRAQLGLADTAPDAEVIAGLLAVIATLGEKYETLLGEAAGQDADLANRALADFADRIPEGTEDYWRDQLLMNRDATLAVLGKLPAPAAPAAVPEPAAVAPTPQPSAAPVPLKNRVAAPPAREPVPTQDKKSDADAAARAAQIRNRALQIQREQRIPWSTAFDRATAEIPAK